MRLLVLLLVSVPDQVVAQTTFCDTLQPGVTASGACAVGSQSATVTWTPVVIGSAFDFGVRAVVTPCSTADLVKLDLKYNLSAPGPYATIRTYSFDAGSKKTPVPELTYDVPGVGVATIEMQVNVVSSGGSTQLDIRVGAFVNASLVDTKIPQCETPASPHGLSPTRPLRPTPRPCTLATLRITPPRRNAHAGSGSTFRRRSSRWRRPTSSPSSSSNAHTSCRPRRHHRRSRRLHRPPSATSSSLA